MHAATKDARKYLLINAWHPAEIKTADKRNNIVITASDIFSRHLTTKLCGVNEAQRSERPNERIVMFFYAHTELNNKLLHRPSHCKCKADVTDAH